MLTEEGTKADYYHMLSRKHLFVVLCVLLIVIAFGISLTVGFYDIGFIETYEVIFDHIVGNPVNASDDNIIWDTRLPVSLFAILCGGVLAAGGAVMQSVLRNPLADPYTMGISSGASLGAALAIILGVSLIPGLSDNVSLTLMAFVFSLIPVAIILLMSRKHRVTPTKLILIGVAVMYMFSAITSLLMVTASDETLSEVYSWMVGSLSGITWSSLPIPLVISVICLVLIYTQYRSINVSMSGNRCARSMGVDTKKLILRMMVLISLMTAAVVSYTGSIGFVGLVAPHIARIFVGSESKYLIPSSIVFGALFLLIANSIAKVTSDFGLPVGVISAIIGCPIFVIVLLKMRKNAWK